MADIKFSQFANTPTPNANAFFVGYNGVTGINSRTTLTDLITAIGAPSGSGTTNFISKWSGTNTLTDSLFYSDANVAKTIYGGNDKGLFIDFVNSITSLANNQGFGFIANPWDLYLGDFNDLQNSTTLQILDANRIIKTRDYGGDRGLYLDFTNDVYTLGVNSTNCFEVTNGIKRTIFNNGTSGLYLDGNSYYLGYYVNNTDPSGGMYGLYLENTYAGLGDKNFNLNGLNLIVDWNDEATKIKSTYAGADKGLYLDFTNNEYVFGGGSNDYPNLRINNAEIAIGDVYSNNNFTQLLINDSDEQIKTLSQGANKGLYIDFANNVYLFGNADNVPNQLAINGNELILGDAFNNVNSTKFIIDDNLQTIKTSNAGADKGLFLNFVSDELALWDINQLGLYIQSPYASFGKPTFGYEFRVDNNNCNIGDYQYEANGTILSVDASINQIIKTRNQGADKGLYLDFTNGIYGLGFTETGDWVGEDAIGVKLTTDNITIGDTWGYSSYIDINFSSSRTQLNTNRVKYRNLTTTEINALTATAFEGDVVYNSTLHKLCFYDGTSWQQLTSIPM